MAGVDTALSVLDKYTLSVMNSAAPSWLIEGVFREVLSDQQKLNAINTEFPLSYIPSLLDTITAPSPPTLEWIKALPRPLPNTWGVYLLLLEKRGDQPALYCGSGTRQVKGVEIRFEDYEFGRQVPRRVQHYLDKGYKITGHGMLCWCPIPPVRQVGTVRVRVVGLEGVLSHIFCTMSESSSDHLWGNIWPWSHDAVQWQALSTHSPFTERPQRTGMIHLSEAAFAAYNAERLRVAKEKQAEAGRRWRENLRETDPENVEFNKMLRGYHHRKVASGVYHCEVCNVSLSKPTALDRHFKTKGHQEQVRLANGGKPKELSREQKSVRSRITKIKESKKFSCPICGFSFGQQALLDRHNATPRHQKKAEQAATTV